MKRLIMLLVGFFCFTIFHTHCFIDNDIHTRTFIGKDIEPYQNDIADLCVTIFREYPALYEGTREECVPVIETYAHSPYGIACILFDKEKAVGVAIGSALTDKNEYYDEIVLQQHTINPPDFFYLGEIVLLKEYRSQGYGKHLYTEFEQAVKNLNSFSSMLFCKTIEPSDKSLKPTDYYSMNNFWIKQGYAQHATLIINFNWRDLMCHEINEHPMNVWTKPLH